MKKKLFSILSVMMIFSLCACTGNTLNTVTKTEVKTVTDNNEQTITNTVTQNGTTEYVTDIVTVREIYTLKTPVYITDKVEETETANSDHQYQVWTNYSLFNNGDESFICLGIVDSKMYGLKYDYNAFSPLNVYDYEATSSDFQQLVDQGNAILSDDYFSVYDITYHSNKYSLNAVTGTFLNNYEYHKVYFYEDGDNYYATISDLPVENYATPGELYIINGDDLDHSFMVIEGSLNDHDDTIKVVYGLGCKPGYNYIYGSHLYELAYETINVSDMIHVQTFAEDDDGYMQSLYSYIYMKFNGHYLCYNMAKK